MSDENSEEKKPTSTYPVGYGKPPAQTRFKKGKSGNPTGRPKGTPNFATALERALAEPVVVNEGGQRRTVTKLVATATQLANKATMGDARATQQVIKLAPIMDNEANPVSDGIPNTEADAIVIAHLFARLRTLKGDAANDPHT